MARAYLFEAKGIQRWLLEGGKLRDIASGSALLSWLARGDERDLLASVQAAAGFVATASRRAGGAFVLHFGDGEADSQAFDRFRALWRLTVMRLAPGLEFSEALATEATEADARKAVYEPLARYCATRQNSAASLLPLGHPLAELAGRTGRPAMEKGDALDPDEEGLDAVLLARRRAGGVLVGGAHPHLTDRTAEILAGAFPGRSLKWPNRMEDERGVKGVTFPFEGPDTRIAVLHADISALGDFYERLGKAAARAVDPVGVSRRASMAIEQAVADAACEAARTLKPAAGDVMPARPVLIGGDDVTVILRADFALEFAEAFLTALEETSRARLDALCKETGLPEADFAISLTAAAGVAVGGAKQPFFRLLELAESLCGFAKGRAKAAAGMGNRPRSVVAFHRITESALAASAADLFQRLDTPAGRLAAQPYQVGTAGVGEFFPALADLNALRAALDAEALRPGGLRAIRGLLQTRKTSQAENDWRRWRAMAGRRSAGALAEFDARLALVTGLEAEPATVESLFKGRLAAGSTPLFDAMEWRALR